MTTFTTQDRIHAEKDGSFTIDCRSKPLTDEQILEIASNNQLFWEKEIIKFVRLIEQAHGIK